MNSFRIHLLLLRTKKMKRFPQSIYRILFTVIISVFAFPFSILAQETEQENYFDQSSVAVRLHYGFILAHRPSVQHLVRHTAGFEVSVYRQTTGKKPWHSYFGYPQTGFTYVFLDFNNPQILGTAHGLLAFVNLPFTRSEHFQFSFRMGSGLGYVTKKYERVENYKNDVIGSHLNAAIQFNFETRTRLSKHLFFNLNVGLTHFSNGSFRTPNLGINNPSANAGFMYQIQPSKEFTKHEEVALDKKIHVDVLYASGVKESYPPAGRQYFIHTLSSTALKRVSRKMSIGLGMDVFYDLALLKLYSNKGETVDNDMKLLRSGIHEENELMFDKLSVLFQMGVYFFDQYKDDGIFYHRVGFKYLVSDHLFVNLTLKTHFAKADFAELGVGWKFGKRTNN